MSRHLTKRLISVHLTLEEPELPGVVSVMCSEMRDLKVIASLHCGLCSFVCFQILPSLTLNNSLNFESRKKTFYTLIRYIETNVSMKTEFQKKSSLMSYCIEKLSWSQQIAARRFLYEWKENFHTISNM